MLCVCPNNPERVTHYIVGSGGACGLEAIYAYGAHWVFRLLGHAGEGFFFKKERYFHVVNRIS